MICGELEWRGPHTYDKDHSWPLQTVASSWICSFTASQAKAGRWQQDALAGYATIPTWPAHVVHTQLFWPASKMRLQMGLLQLAAWQAAALMLSVSAGTWQQLGALRESSPMSSPALPCTGDINVSMTPYLPLLVLEMQSDKQMNVRGACWARLGPGCWLKVRDLSSKRLCHCVSI